MIIFDLDGTLADCEHRRHFVDPFYSHIKYAGTVKHSDKFKPDWKSFYEACDQDTLIQPVWQMFIDRLDMGLKKNIQIWSGRCESVKQKTEKWLMKYLSPNGLCELPILKMRPIGDNTPDDELKERWLDEYYQSGTDNCLLRWATHDRCCKKIDFVFDSNTKAIEMYRRRGIFVFNCCQHDGEF